MGLRPYSKMDKGITTLNLQHANQADLVQISARFQLLKELSITSERDYEEEDEEVELEFSAAGLCFPALRELTLVGVSLKSIKFTTENTPNLRQLTIEQVEGDCAPFYLDLPELRNFQSEHTMIGGRGPEDVGQFGLSISRCPKLKRIDTYASQPCRLPPACTITSLPFLPNSAPNPPPSYSTPTSTFRMPLAGHCC